jgi:hypothetical protein
MIVLSPSVGDDCEPDLSYFRVEKKEKQRKKQVLVEFLERKVLFGCG